MDKHEIFNIIKINKKHLKKYGVKRIGLFGSYAKGNQKEHSDLDFIIEFEEGKKSFDNYMELNFLLKDLFDKDIDLVIAGTIKPELKDSIMESVEYA